VECFDHLIQTVGLRQEIFDSGLLDL
jgi:hypothetical protein